MANLRIEGALGADRGLNLDYIHELRTRDNGNRIISVPRILHWQKDSRDWGVPVSRKRNAATRCRIRIVDVRTT